MKKSFSTSLVFAAVAALARAELFIYPNGTAVCPVANGVYCSANIIIRCNGTVGEPGNCNDNLNFMFPQDGLADCYSPSAGVGACAKNCVVYGGSGNLEGTFTVPSCTPAATPSSSASTGTQTSTPYAAHHGHESASHKHSALTTPGPLSPPVLLSTQPASSPSGSPSTVCNGTTTQTPTGQTGLSITPTSVRVSTNSAATNRAGFGLAVVGLLAAFLL